MHVAAREPRSVGGDGTDQDHGSQMRKLLDNWPDRLRQRRGGDERGGAAVGEDIGVLRHIEERIERDGDAAGAHRSPERHRIIHRVVQQQRDAFFLPDAERAQRIGEANGARL